MLEILSGHLGWFVAGVLATLCVVQLLRSARPRSRPPDVLPEQPPCVVVNNFIVTGPPCQRLSADDGRAAFGSGESSTRSSVRAVS